MRVPTHPEWHRAAACHGVDPSVMVDELGNHPAIAKRFCASCPVVVACFNEAMANPQLLGVWGGTTTKERHQKRARRAP